MVAFGFLALTGSMALGVYGLVHRGLELVVGGVMVLLVIVGFWAVLHGIGV